MTESLWGVAVACGIVGGLLLAWAWVAAEPRHDEPERPVTFPGPGSMESRMHYGHLADVLNARRQWDREGIEQTYRSMR